MKKILLVVMLTLVALSLTGIYYRYVLVEDFSYETKPIDEFTEDDF